MQKTKLPILSSLLAHILNFTVIQDVTLCSIAVVTTTSRTGHFSGLPYWAWSFPYQYHFSPCFFTYSPTTTESMFLQNVFNITAYQTICRHIQESSNLHSQCHDNHISLSILSQDVQFFIPLAALSGI
jgi:hypothetical protein